MPNFAGLWCPNYLTQGYSLGIIGKITSVAFIWYLVALCVTDSLVTIASWKSGLILSSLKILISVLSNKAVLDTIHCEVPGSILFHFWFCQSFQRLLKFLMNVLHKKRWTGLKIYAGNGHDNGTVKQWYAEKFDSFMAVKIRIFSLKYLEACLL